MLRDGGQPDLQSQSISAWRAGNETHRSTFSQLGSFSQRRHWKFFLMKKTFFALLLRSSKGSAWLKLWLTGIDSSSSCPSLFWKCLPISIMMLRIDFFVSRHDLSRVKCEESKNRPLRPTTVVQLLVPLRSNKQKLKKTFAPLSRDFLTDNATHRAFIQPMGALWNQSQIHDWCGFLILATSVISNCLTVPAVSLRVNVSMFFKVREPLESLQQSKVGWSNPSLFPWPRVGG